VHLTDQGDLTPKEASLVLKPPVLDGESRSGQMPKKQHTYRAGRIVVNTICVGLASRAEHLILASQTVDPCRIRNCRWW
jgi:hypothetical protein